MNDKISGKYRALLNDVNEIHHSIANIEKTLMEERDNLTYEKYKEFQRTLKVKAEESKKISLLADGMFLAREEVLNLY